MLRVVNIASDCGYTPWNFHKYLIDRQGRGDAVFPSQIDPLDRRITGRVEQLPEGR